MVAALESQGLWPPLVPSVVLAESISGRQRRDANINRFLKTCDIIPTGRCPGEREDSLCCVIYLRFVY